MQDFKNLINLTPWAFQGVLDDKEALAEALAARPLKRVGPPFFSLITPLWNTPPKFLEDAIGSCLLQTCPDWELILVDDGSTSRQHIETARKFAALDERIQLHEETQNGGISRARNRALEFASGQYVAILDHDDLLHPFILSHYKHILAREDFDLLFCNEVKIDSAGKKLSDYFYKPHFDRQTLLRTNYIAHFSVVKAARIEELKAKHNIVFDTRFDGVEDHQYFLRLSDLPGFRAKRSPVFGYYWRKSPTSTAGELSAKPYVRTRLCSMLEEFAKPAVTVQWIEGKRLPIWTYQLPQPTRLDVHIWGSNATECVNHLRQQTGVELGQVSESPEEKYYPTNLHRRSTPDGKGHFLLIIHASTRFRCQEGLGQLLGFLANAPDYGSVSPCILDRKSLDRGDWSLMQQAWGRDSAPSLRSLSLDSDFSREQRLGLLPSPLCTVVNLMETKTNGVLEEILGPYFLDTLQWPERKHFYLGNVEARFESDRLPIPGTLTPLAFAGFSPDALTVLENRQMSYDPQNRWIHGSQIADDWFEVPLRYRFVDGLNQRFKKWLAPLHHLIKQRTRKRV